MPNITKALSEPCSIYKQTIWLSITILFIAALLSFIVMKSNNSNLNESLLVVSLQIVFITIYTYAVLFFDDSISSFAFLTRTCGIHNAL